MAADPPPSVRVAPETIFKAASTEEFAMVMVAPAELVKVAFTAPVILIEFKVMVGTAVMVTAVVITTSSLATGSIAGLQFVAVVQAAPDAPTQVFVAPKEEVMNNDTRKKTRLTRFVNKDKGQKPMDRYRALDGFEVNLDSRFVV